MVMLLLPIPEYVVVIVADRRLEYAVTDINNYAVFTNVTGKNMISVETVTDYDDVSDVSFYNFLWLLSLLETIALVVSDIGSGSYLYVVHQCS